MEFNNQINKFQTLGLYDYKFDEVGNVIANSASAEFSYNYLALPLRDMVYDTQSITAYYDVDFTEFVPALVPVSATDTTINSTANQDLITENNQLKSKIDDLIQLSESNSAVAKNDAIKRVILDLRIALKEGKEDREFSDVFPYTAKAIN